MKISLVAPAFNEERCIEEFVSRMDSTLTKLGGEYEIIVVDDGSRDETPEKLAGLQEKYPQLRVVTLTKRCGQHVATAVGLKASTGELVCTMDSDLQVAPESIGTLLDAGSSSGTWDVISGCRTSRSRGMLRSFSSKLISLSLQRMGRTRLKDPGSTFKLLKREAVDALCEYDVLIQNLPILMVYLGFEIKEAEIEYNTNEQRRSRYGLMDLAVALFLAFLNFSTGMFTLVVLLCLGLVLFAAGGSGVVALSLRGMATKEPLPTNLLLFFIALLVMGLQFNFLGIIAFKLERVNRNLGFRRTLTRQRNESVQR